MIDFINSFGLAPGGWLLVLLSSALVGMNKTGLAGLSLIAVSVMASVFGGKSSTGVLLPMLIAADAIAVFSYRRSICWKDLFRLIPWILIGLGIALYVGESVSDHVFKLCIAAVILVALIAMVIREIRGGAAGIKPGWYINAGVGILGGFAAMIGNVAGPIIGVYFLSIHMEKDEFIATRAWFFWIVNLIKVPFHVLTWKTIDFHTLGFNLVMLPAIILGGFVGILIVKKIADRPYRIFLICITALSAVFLII